jgi:hypothetical protein
MFVKVAWRKSRLLKPFLQDTAARPAKWDIFRDGAMPRSLANYYDPVTGPAADNGVSHGNIAMFLTQSAGPDTLL